MKKNIIKKEVYFLDENTEVKIINTNIPHQTIYIRNEDGVFKISEYPTKDEHQKKEASPKN